MTKPRGGPSHFAVVQQMRDMTVMADEGGFDVAWFAEHHLSNYSISPSPLMPVVHMAPQTKRIKLGPAVIVMPFYEPLRLVEDICYADQLAEGRLVLGLGTGYQPREFSKFGFAIEDRLQRGLEVWDVIEQALTRGVVDYTGDHVSIADAALSIAPRQGRIETYAVGNAPEMRQKMIDYGAIPMTTSGAGPLDLVTTAHRLFKETRAENGIAGDGFPFAVQRYVFVTEDRAAAETAAEQILVHARMAANMRRSAPEMTGSDLDIVPFEGEPTLAQIFERAIIGDAEAVTERILADAEAHGMTHLSAFMQFAGLPYDLALRSLDLFCDRVVPAVRKGKGPGKRALAS